MEKYLFIYTANSYYRSKKLKEIDIVNAFGHFYFLIQGVPRLIVILHIEIIVYLTSRCFGCGQCQYFESNSNVAQTLFIWYKTKKMQFSLLFSSFRSSSQLRIFASTPASPVNRNSLSAKLLQFLLSQDWCMRTNVVLEKNHVVCGSKPRCNIN